MADAVVVLSDEELGVLWTLAGRPLFGYVPWPELDEARFQAVARGLLARGFIREGDPPLMAPDVERLLGVAMFADQMLRCTINQFGPVDPATRQEVFWRKGEALVHHTPSFAGTHRFRGCDRSAFDAMLADMLDLSDDDGSEPGSSHTLTEREYVDALEIVQRDGTGAAAARYPMLADYLRAMQDPHPLTSIEVRDDELAGDELSLLDSPQRGLWMQRDGAGRTIVVQRIDAETAREQVAKLVGAFA
jgi:hypothetical protein